MGFSSEPIKPTMEKKTSVENDNTMTLDQDYKMKGYRRVIGYLF